MEVQCYELKKIFYKNITKGMCLDEWFQNSFIIDKLSPSLKGFKKNSQPQDKRIFNWESDYSSSSQRRISEIR